MTHKGRRSRKKKKERKNSFTNNFWCEGTILTGSVPDILKAGCYAV
jgi:hypothetical protein